MYYLSFFHNIVVVVVVVDKCIRPVFTYGFRTRFGNFKKLIFRPALKHLMFLFCGLLS